MRKIVLIVFLTLGLTSCNQKKSFSRNHNSENYISVENITKLENYNNKRIEITGEFHMDFENLYLEKNGNKMWLNFDFYQNLRTEDNQILNGEKLKTFNSKKIKIRGKLKIGHKGHLGIYKAELNDIVFFEN